MQYSSGSETMGHEIIEEFYKNILLTLSTVKNVTNTICFSFKEKKTRQEI